jgi:Ni,Fe-hydrogenase III large subunit
MLVGDRDTWRLAAEDLKAEGAKLMALWTDATGKGGTVYAALLIRPGLLILSLRCPPSSTTYPGLQDLFPSASRMQRAAADLTGVLSSDPDLRAWIRHEAWNSDAIPLAGTEMPVPPSPPPLDAYAFVRVEGEGVHEIPVGPVHAGIIEPGHFRFSIVGEKVLRLEQRLGYVHKGIERRFTEMSLGEGHKLAARISGDSAVAYSWAYCQAAEGISGTVIPSRATWLRALALELERIANHLGDLGALGNDAGFAFGLAQFSRLKESLLRATEHAFGQRYLLDFVVPGGTRAEISDDRAQGLMQCVDAIQKEAAILRSIYEEHAGVRDRFAGAGRLSKELASRLGVVGLAGRASGQALDLRVDLPCAPYDVLKPEKCGFPDGDVLARVSLRFDELAESCGLVPRILEEAPSGSVATPFDDRSPAGFATGFVEGWRGPVMIALESGPLGCIRRCHAHDPSWQNWPALEHAIIGNIVPDFPLINKSFNLSYSGHDL